MKDIELGKVCLESLRFRFGALKELGEKAMSQMGDGDLFRSPGADTNSVAVIVQHLHGNMRSRWTDFLTTDGEKASRDREGEFAAPSGMDRGQVMALWAEGWTGLLEAVESLKAEDLTRTVTIRGQALTALDAIHRQVAHYAYHVGQIVLTARLVCGEGFESISIPRGQSKSYRPEKRD